MRHLGTDQYNLAWFHRGDWSHAWYGEAYSGAQTTLCGLPIGRSVELSTANGSEPGCQVCFNLAKGVNQ